MGLFSSKTNGYISRNTWNAVEPYVTTPLRQPIKNVFITAVEGHSYLRQLFYMDDCLRFLSELQKVQMFDEGLPDIAYNFYVGGDGNVYEGRGWYDAPTLKKEELQGDTETLAIAYIRQYPDCKPSNVMVSKVKEVINYGVEQGYIDENYAIEGLIDGLDENKI